MAGQLKHLISELRRRKVFGVAAGYAVVAWGVIEVSATVLQMAGAPAWIAKVVLAVVAAGFPIALILAWIFDLSASGVVRTGDVDQLTPATASRTRQIAAAVVIGVFALIAALAVWLRPSAAPNAEFTQLTNFADAATAPALSPDGRTVAFLKGAGYFGNSTAVAQVYVKQLPNGDAVQLTTSEPPKATPAFSPDGTRVAFTLYGANWQWSTHVVSSNGGPETELLPNASGLIWLDDEHVLFSEIRRGIHMGVRRATLSRADAHDLYWPASEVGMAHRMAVSPDGHWVLLAEMDAGVWQACRVVPFSGESRGHNIGPPNAQCTYGGWSPDGRWMYFSSNAGGAFHLWRQRFPDGKAEQITFGPTEEEGIAVAPDGRSLITSAGVRHNSIWLRENEREREVSVEEYAFSPVASRDGKRVYFLSRVGTTRREYNVGNLVETTLATGARARLLPEHAMVHFSLSPDDRLIAFVSASDESAARGIWVARMDRSAPPRRVFAGETERVLFDAAANMYFLTREGRLRFLHRLRAPDYTVDERVSDEPVIFMYAISPDGEWIAVALPLSGTGGVQQVAISTRGAPRRVLCSFCGGGVGPGRLMAPPLTWTRDGRAFLVSAQFLAEDAMAAPAYTIIIPLAAGSSLPALPPMGIKSVQDYLKLPAARTVPQQNVFPGATADQLLFYASTTIRNLYRVQLR